MASKKGKNGLLKQGKYFCFTAFHYDGGLNSEDPAEDMPQLYYRLREAFDRGDIVYAVCQEEVCPETGQNHIQGYIEYPTNQRLTGLRSSELWEGEVVRFLNAKGTGAENTAYCSKRDDRPDIYKNDDLRVFVVGEIHNVGKGARSDIISVKRAIDRGESAVDIWRNDTYFEPMLKYHKGFSVYEQIARSTRAKEAGERNVEVIVYWGPPGTGKSYRAHVECGASIAPDNFYVVPMPKGSGLYFDGYMGQECVLIDEMRGSRMPHQDLLRLLDRYPTTVPIHGGIVDWRPRRVILTSNEHPFEWYRTLNLRDAPTLTAWRALERRITAVEHMTVKYAAPDAPVRVWDPPGGIAQYLLNNPNVDAQAVARAHDQGNLNFPGQL